MSKAVILKGIGNRMRHARKSARVSLDALAKLTGMSKTGLWQIEQGVSDPCATTLIRLCFVLDCGFDWLILGKHPLNKLPVMERAARLLLPTEDDDEPTHDQQVDQLYKNPPQDEGDA